MKRQISTRPLVAAFAVSLALVGAACSSKATTRARTAPPPQATSVANDDTSTTVAAPTVSTETGDSAATTTTTIVCRTVTDPPPPSIKLGDCGPMVESIQTQLAVAGFAVNINGEFDAATDQAVKDFQAANALEVDGLVGPITFLALFGSLGD